MWNLDSQSAEVFSPERCNYMSGKNDAEKCITATRVTRVKIEGEHRRSAVFVNNDRATYRVIKVDGCLVRKGPAADWILAEHEVGDLVIELKGRDVGRALEQA